MLGFHTSAHCIHRQFSQVLRVVVFAGSEGVEATREAIDWGFEPHIIVVGKEDVEATIELRGCQLMKMPRYKSATYQLGLGALWDRQQCRTRYSIVSLVTNMRQDVLLSLSWEIEKGESALGRGGSLVAGGLRSHDDRAGAAWQLG